MIESLLPVKGGREFIAQVSGYVSAPRERRTTRDSQYFFINQRFVKDKIIAGGLLEGFRSVLPHGVYPVAFLFLEIPNEELDVNVHPAKTEVRFRRAQAVKDVIAEAIRQSLQNAGIVRQATENKSQTAISQREIEIQQNETGNNPGQKPEIINQADSDAPTKKPDDRLTITKIAEQTNIDFEIPTSSQDFESLAAERISNETSSQTLRGKTSDSDLTDDKGDNFENKSSDLQFQKAEAQSLNTENQPKESQIIDYLQSPQTAIQNPIPPVDSAEAIPKPAEVEELSASRVQIVGQLHNSFIIATDAEGLLLIDQHVAHERILFDKFRQKETERKIESQNLLLPETIDLTPAQSVAFEEIREELENCGFGLMKLSGRTIAIKSVPTDLPSAEIRNLFSEILDTVEKEKRGAAKSSIRDDIAASMACKAAVKINMKLTAEKMSWMIDKLLTTSSPTTCPHGRPVILRLTMKDIERKFHR